MDRRKRPRRRATKVAGRVEPVRAKHRGKGATRGRTASKAESLERKLRAAQSVSRVLGECFGIAQAAPGLLAAVGESLGWEVGAIWEPDPVARELRCIDVWRGDAARGAAFEALTRATRFPPGVGLPGRVWVSGRSVWVSDVVEDSNFPRARVALADGLHAAFAFPLTLGSAVVGVMEFFCPEIRQPDDTLLGMFTLVGAQIGQFVERTNSERRLRLILEKSLDAYVSMSAEGRILEWNGRAEHLFMWPRAEAVGRLLADTIIPPSHRRAHKEGLGRFLKTGEGLILTAQIETIGMKRDGSEFPVELAVTPVQVAGVWTFHGFIRDITARKQIERALRTGRSGPRGTGIASPGA
jgi:PAS domain S-box-containing protein